MDQKITVVILACRQAVPDPDLWLGPLQQAGLLARVVLEPCSSKVETFQLLRTLAVEADLLWVVGCPEADCQLVEGSFRMAKRVAHAQEYLLDSQPATRRP
jgi:coenzyme F420-reducing hydrogenase delta subunit